MWIIRLVVLLGLHQPFAQVEATTYGYTTDNGNFFFKFKVFHEKVLTFEKITLYSEILTGRVELWIISGPATWTGLCQNTSTFQSPIDIPYDYDHLHKVNDWLPFQWIHYGNFT